MLEPALTPTDFREILATKSEISLEAQMAWMAWNVYDWDRRNVPEGWVLTQKTEMPDGFRSGLFQKVINRTNPETSKSESVVSNLAIMAICGTREEEDLWDCQGVFEGNMPGQFTSALATFDSWSWDCEIVFVVGHSLGGVLATLLAYFSSKPVKSYAFNSPGIGELLDVPSSVKFPQMRSRCVQDDFIAAFGTHVEEHCKVLKPVGYASSIFAPHRAWKELALGTPVPNTSLNYERCISKLKQQFSNAEIAVEMLNNGMIDLLTLAYLSNPATFNQGIERFATLQLGEFGRTKLGRVIRSSAPDMLNGWFS